MNAQSQEQMEQKPMTFAQLCRIWDRQQRIKAHSAITKKDRAKVSLTYKEKLNKFAQLGNKVRYKDMYFTFDVDTAMGLIVTPTKKILGASLDEFLDLARSQGAVINY